MAERDSGLENLREAARQSPDNLPLRQHLADQLLRAGYPEEAEAEYRSALELAPGNARLLGGLARAFYHQGKNSEALVIVEDLVARPGAEAGQHALHARILISRGDVEKAVSACRRALELDAGADVADLAASLGLTAGGGAPEGNDERIEDTVIDGRERARHEEPDGPSPESLMERPGINFADVGGMEPLKDEIRMKIILPLEKPEIFEAYGKKAGGGILMYGPPGCGKTLLARATAGEVKASFLSVGIADVLEMWIGQSERNLQAVFRQARDSAPCVLFFDEVDALGASRSDMRRSGGRQTINQFLAELDGMEGANREVLVLAATNTPWHLDTAFRRPGRFDRIIFVPPPDEAARKAILEVLLRDKPAAEVDCARLAAKTADFSGADLKGVVDLAVESSLAAALKRGEPQPLTTRDLLKAAKRVKPSTREWFATARNYALYSNQGGFYDDILDYLKLR